jgi:transposase
MSPELWSRIPPEAQVIFREMAETIKRLEARVAELERRLGMNSQNSSLPPSTQHPHAKPAPRPKPSGKRPGGQPGHNKHERALVPPERLDETVVLKPDACRRCGKRLGGSDPAPLRHQVWELPEIKPLITEYQRHRLVCECCGVSTCAALPRGVPEHQSGPRLVAFVALLMAHFRQSKRRVSLFCESVLNTPCSPGLVVKLQNRATAALRPHYEHLAAALPLQPALNIDESPTKEAAHKSWLWTFVAPEFTVFGMRPTRGGEVLDEFLGPDFRGVAMCDRARMYWRLPRLQWCWAHLQRDFQALADSPLRSVKDLGKQLLEQARRVFRQWSRCRDGTISRAGLKSSLGPVRRAVERLLLRGLRGRHARTAEVCRELSWHGARLWMFLDQAGVEPTNNAAERSLRPAVIWRKLSFGTQSPAGSRFVETLLSVIETCRQQARDVFAFVTHALERHFAHRPPASLVAGV